VSVTDKAFEAITAAGFSLYLRDFSAIDAYLGRQSGPGVRLITNGDIAELARLFEGLRYPGVELADAALDCGEKTLYFRCVDWKAGEGPPVTAAAFHPSFRLLAFYQNLESRRFYDPLGVYPLLRQIRGVPDRGETRDHPAPEAPDPWYSLEPDTPSYRALMDAALILARYGISPEGSAGPKGLPPAALLRDLPPKSEAQRVFLTELLLSPNPARGLEFLKNKGFIGEIWPELAGLDRVDHSKEYHPEGNVWDHTLETFRYRKAVSQKAVYDLRLSLGLLLHDLGKPLAESSGSRRFDGHAELGARAARRFLERLEFTPALIEDVFYLVKNHMLPAALPRLPLQRTEEIMASPLFPLLMELYRCDESSSFKGLEGYYQSSAAYQSFLRCRRNPYRSADGKKLHRAGG
jgi:poly(A) polymerase